MKTRLQSFEKLRPMADQGLKAELSPGGPSCGVGREQQRLVAQHCRRQDPEFTLVSYCTPSTGRNFEKPWQDVYLTMTDFLQVRYVHVVIIEHSKVLPERSKGHLIWAPSDC